MIKDLNQILNNLLENRKCKHPKHILFMDFVRGAINEGYEKSEVKKFCNKLHLENKIEIGDTINDKWIKLKNK